MSKRWELAPARTRRRPHSPKQRKKRYSKHRRGESGRESLTPMEEKVAAFVAKGLSNPEVAERLGLSRRTVGTHVSHILKKTARELPDRYRAGVRAEDGRRAVDPMAVNEGIAPHRSLGGRSATRPADRLVAAQLNATVSRIGDCR